MATGKQLRKAIRIKELSMEQAAEKLNISRATLYNLVNKGELDDEIIQSVKSKLDIDLNDISIPFHEERRSNKLMVSALMVPLVPIKAQAGYIQSHDLIDFIEQLEKFPMAPGINPRGAEWRWFEVQGESMEPTLYEGDYLLCSMVPQDDWQNLENYYLHVIVAKGSMWVKRVFRKSKTVWVLISDNKKIKKEHIQRDIPVEDIREVWKVRRHLNARMPPPEKIVIHD
jgi:phage repressor protein C with HTH and peptisase S24 domain